MSATDREKERAAKIVGWHRAAAETDILLEYAGAYQRVVAAGDVGKTVGELVCEVLNEKRDALEKGDRCGPSR